MALVACHRETIATDVLEKAMFVNLSNGGRLAVTFQYREDLVRAVKRVPGRMFDKKLKRWIIPQYHIEKCYEILHPLGFSFPADVQEALTRARETREKLEKVRRDPSAYAGDLPLFDFQRSGAAFIHESDSTLLGFQPGLGKTLTTLAACDTMKMKRVLVVCPKSLLYGWEDEIYKWLPSSNVIVIDGGPETRMKLYERAFNESSWYMLMGYETMRNDIEILQKMSYIV